MSKAFTKEENNVEEPEVESSQQTPPKGVKNYITPAGARKLEAELHHLMTVERPKIVEVVSWAASLGDRSENADYIYGKRRLREIDRRIRFLTKRLDNIEVVDPEKRPQIDQVFFGATVSVMNDTTQKHSVYRIVGIDETDGTKGKISWISPVGKALLKAKTGDVISVKTPQGEIDLEILKIEYKKID